jgi:hypothetical protein
MTADQIMDTVVAAGFFEAIKVAEFDKPLTITHAWTLTNLVDRMGHFCNKQFTCNL